MGGYIILFIWTFVASYGRLSFWESIGVSCLMLLIMAACISGEKESKPQATSR